MMLFSQFHLAHIAHCREVVVNQIWVILQPIFISTGQLWMLAKVMLILRPIFTSICVGECRHPSLVHFSAISIQVTRQFHFVRESKEYFVAKQNGGLLYSQAKTNLSNCSWIWKEVRICESYHRTLFDVSYVEINPIK